MIKVIICSYLCSTVSLAAVNADYDSIIEETHARAMNVRQERIAGFAAHTDFTKAFNMHTPIPANCSPKSHTWTGKGAGRKGLLL